MRILHLSDLHFGPPLIPGLCAALLRFAYQIEPNVIVVTGDFTQRARPEQFIGAAKLLKELPSVPALYVPGNHDIPLFRLAERLFSPYALYRRHISAELSPVLKLPGATIVGVNTTHPYRSVTRGYITSDDLLLCRKAFEGTGPGDLRVIATHHPVAMPTHIVDIEETRYGTEALELFHSLAVDLVLSGHVHESTVYFSNSTQASQYRIPLALCGTTTSSRLRGIAGVNSLQVIDVAREELRITSYTYDSELTATFVAGAVSKHSRRSGTPRA